MTRDVIRIFLKRVQIIFITAQNREWRRQMPFCPSQHYHIGTFFVLKTLAKTKIPLHASSLRHVRAPLPTLEQWRNTLEVVLFLESVKTNSTNKVLYASFLKSLIKRVLPAQTFLKYCRQTFLHSVRLFHITERLSFFREGI